MQARVVKVANHIRAGTLHSIPSPARQDFKSRRTTITDTLTRAVTHFHSIRKLPTAAGHHGANSSADHSSGSPVIVGPAAPSPRKQLTDVLLATGSSSPSPLSWSSPACCVTTRQSCWLLSRRSSTPRACASSARSVAAPFCAPTTTPSLRGPLRLVARTSPLDTSPGPS